jgi:hypothetical protein
MSPGTASDFEAKNLEVLRLAGFVTSPWARIVPTTIVNNKEAPRIEITNRRL